MLRFRVAWYGGKISLEDDINLYQTVIFQGRGNLKIEKGVTLGYPIGGAFTLPILLQPREPDSIIQIGAGSALVNGIEIIARTRISIGAGCRIGARCIILDADFHDLNPNERSKVGKTAPVMIGDNVWLGLDVIVLKGVSIGNDAVVGAGCVVSKDVPAGSIAVGNPMKIIGTVYDDGRSINGYRSS